MLNNDKNGWIPVSNGKLPKEGQHVQITYLGFHDKVPYCDGFAYLCNDEWFWSHSDEEVNVKVTAWKYTCEPYLGE